MKQIVSLLACIAMCMPCTYGQSFAFTGNYSGAVLQGSFPAYPDNDKSIFHLSTETKVGFGIAGAGIIIGCIGIEKYRTNSGGTSYEVSNNRNEKLGAGMWLAGGIVAIMGSVFAIDGGIHDMRRYHKEHRLSISNSEGNQLGLAYNFR